MGANVASWRRLKFTPKVLNDVDDRDLSIELFGDTLRLPLLLAPTGLTRIVSPRHGELAAARAAANEGVVYVTSTAASLPVDQIAKSTPAPKWLQLYLWNNREVTERLLMSAGEAGYRVVCVTIDTAVRGNRERDRRSGFTYPPKLTPRMIWDGVTHPRWTYDLLTTEKIGMANIVVPDEEGTALRTTARSFLAKRIVDPRGRTNWAELEWVRQVWKGPLLVKGVVSGREARQIVDRLGYDGVIVSNHGGRQLDGLPASAEALIDVVEHIGAEATILVDGGIRRGSDIVRALALGARACLIGRPYLYGLAAGGERGVRRVIEIFREEMDRTMALLGVRTPQEIDRSLVLIEK